MSARAIAADAIADKLREYGLDEVYGVDVAKRGRYYAITFCTARTLDGVVNYYGPKFVQVKFQCSYGIGGGSYVYTSADDALKFIKLAFVDFDFEAADAVPVKPSK